MEGVQVLNDQIKRATQMASLLLGQKVRAHTLLPRSGFGFSGEQ
jgi:hypothetical protein